MAIFKHFKLKPPKMVRKIITYVADAGILVTYQLKDKLVISLLVLLLISSFWFFGYLYPILPCLGATLHPAFSSLDPILSWHPVSVGWLLYLSFCGFFFCFFCFLHLLWYPILLLITLWKFLIIILIIDSYIQIKTYIHYAINYVINYTINYLIRECKWLVM